MATKRPLVLVLLLYSAVAAYVGLKKLTKPKQR
jgi:hypothetical protein